MRSRILTFPVWGTPIKSQLYLEPTCFMYVYICGMSKFTCKLSQSSGIALESMCIYIYWKSAKPISEKSVFHLRKSNFPMQFLHSVANSPLSKILRKFLILPVWGAKHPLSSTHLGLIYQTFSS